MCWFSYQSIETKLDTGKELSNIVSKLESCIFESKMWTTLKIKSKDFAKNHLPNIMGGKHCLCYH